MIGDEEPSKRSSMPARNRIRGVTTFPSRAMFIRVVIARIRLGFIPAFAKVWGTPVNLFQPPPWGLHPKIQHTSYTNTVGVREHIRGNIKINMGSKQSLSDTQSRQSMSNNWYFWSPSDSSSRFIIARTFSSSSLRPTT